MRWIPQDSYFKEPFKTEADLEHAIKTVRSALFGESRIYLDVKKLIGAKVEIGQRWWSWKSGGYAGRIERWPGR
jgi:hypothetical protein